MNKPAAVLLHLRTAVDQSQHVPATCRVAHYKCVQLIIFDLKLGRRQICTYAVHVWTSISKQQQKPAGRVDCQREHAPATHVDGFAVAVLKAVVLVAEVRCLLRRLLRRSASRPRRRLSCRRPRRLPRRCDLRRRGCLLQDGTTTSFVSRTAQITVCTKHHSTRPRRQRCRRRRSWGPAGMRALRAPRPFRTVASAGAAVPTTAGAGVPATAGCAVGSAGSGAGGAPGDWAGVCAAAALGAASPGGVAAATLGGAAAGVATGGGSVSELTWGPARSAASASTCPWP